MRQSVRSCVSGHRNSRDGGATRNAPAALTRAGGLAFLLLAGAAGASVLAPWQPAAAQIKVQEVSVQLDEAWSLVRRCDVANAQKAIARLEETSKQLKISLAAGYAPEGTDVDAKMIDSSVAKMKNDIKKCPDPKTATSVKGARGETYVFANADDAGAAVTAIGDVQRYVKNCDREGYRRNYIAVRAQAGRTKDPVAHGVLLQLADDLQRAEAEMFKNCPEPGKAEPPKAEVPKTEPPKTGTGTGSTQPNKPPEPPKAPSDSPDSGHGSVPAFKFRPDVFGQVVFMPQVGAGIVFSGGTAHTIVDSPGTISGAGFNFGLDIPAMTNIFGEKPWWSVDIGFARAGGTSTGSVAPGAAIVGFNYISPNPASGLTFLSHGLNGQNVSIRSHRNQLDMSVLYNAILGDGLVQRLERLVGEIERKVMYEQKGKIEVNVGIGFQYRAIWDTHDVDQSIINFPDVTSHTTLDSSTHFFGPKAMVRMEYEVGRFSVYYGAYVVPGLAVSSGRATQSAACPVCGPSERSVSLTRDDSFTKFAVNVGTRVWVAYEVTPSVTARAFVGYDYFSHAAKWQIDPGSAQLKSGSTGNVRMGLGLNLRF